MPAHAIINSTATRPVLGIGGAQPDGSIYDVSTTPDRHYMVFTSDATNLVADDTNALPDVFVKDLVGGSVSRVSLLPGGGESDGASYVPSISDDGKKVAFTTDSDLFDENNDFNFEPDVYVVNRDADNDGTLDEFTVDGGVDIQRASVGTGGIEADNGARSGRISGNGNWVVFSTDDSLDAADTNASPDVYARSTTSDNTVLISKGSTSGGGGGDLPTINANGRYVVFSSTATDQVSGEPSGGLILQDRDTDNDGTLDESGATANEHVNKSTTGTVSGGAADSAAPASISPDGSCVAFKFLNAAGLTTDATTNAVYLRKRGVTPTTVLASKTVSGLSASEVGNPSVSPNCRYVGFDSRDSALAPNQSGPNARDVFVKDMTTGALDRISKLSSGIGGFGSVGTSLNAQTYNDQASLIFSTAAQISGVSGGNGYSDPFIVDYDGVPTCTPGTPSVSAATRTSLTVTFAKCATPAGYTAPLVDNYTVTMYNRTSATAIATKTIAASLNSVSFTTGITAGSLYRFKVAATTIGGSGPLTAYSGFALPPFKTLDQFTTQQFTDMAGRAPTTTEKTAWSTALTNGTQTAKSYAVTASNFSNWNGNNAAFTRLYQVSFGTIPTITEYNSKTATLRAATTTTAKQTALGNISTGYSSLTTWKTRYPAADSNLTFVTKVFNNAGVPASAARTTAINSYVTQLNSATITRPRVISSVTGYSALSGQSLVVAAQASLVNVTGLFTGMLRRVPLTTELTTWKPLSTTATASQALAQNILSGSAYDTRIP